MQGCGSLMATVLLTFLKKSARLWQPCGNHFFVLLKTVQGSGNLVATIFYRYKKAQGCGNRMATVLLTFLKNTKHWQPYGNHFFDPSKTVQGCGNLMATVLLTFLKSARLWQPCDIHLFYTSKTIARLLQPCGNRFLSL